MDKVELDLGFEVDIDDLSFVHEMVNGGVYDDMSSRSGDISFDNTNDINFQTKNIEQENFTEVVLDVDYEILLDQIKSL